MRTRGPGARLLAIAGLALCLALGRMIFAAQSVNVYYFDPLAGLQAGPTSDQKLNAGFQKLGPAIVVKTFASLKELQSAIAKEAPDFVVLPPYLESQLDAKGPLEPLLIRERDHNWSFEMVIVGPGKLADLKGKTLAAAGEAAQPSFIDGKLLKDKGLTTKDFHVLSVSKDIDGVLAAGQGQAAAAVAAPGSVNLVKKANPTVAEKLNEILKVTNIPFAVLYAYGNQPAANVTTVRDAFSSLAGNPDGNKILKLLKTDRFLIVDPAMKEKLK
jgi:ABC-type phosphate/phosphonate transport system substrate-binding protein